MPPQLCQPEAPRTGDKHESALEAQSPIRGARRYSGYPRLQNSPRKRHGASARRPRGSCAMNQDRETPIPRFALERDRPLSPREWEQEEQLRHKYLDRGKHVSAWRERLIAEPWE